MVHIESVGQNTLDHVNKVLGSFGNGSLATRAVAAAAKRAADKGKTEAGRFAAAEYTIGKAASCPTARSKPAYLVAAAVPRL